MAGPDGRPAAGPIGHRPAPVRRLRAGHRRRVLPAPAKTRHPPAQPATMTLPAAADRGGAAPAPPALPQRCQPQGDLPGRAAKPAPEPPGTTRARSARPCRHTLAVPGEPAAAQQGCPTEKTAPRWSHATGETAPRLTPASQAAIISYSHRRTGPGPVPCHWRNGGPMLLADDTAEVRRAKDVLAGLVAAQWKVEAAVRALDDPDPIPVRWQSSSRDQL